MIDVKRIPMEVLILMIRIKTEGLIELCSICEKYYYEQDYVLVYNCTYCDNNEPHLHLAKSLPICERCRK